MCVCCHLVSTGALSFPPAAVSQKESHAAHVIPHWHRSSGSFRGTIPSRLLAAQSARGFQAPTPFIPLRTSASCSSCSPDKPAFINPLRRSRYTQVFAVLHHGVFTKSHLLGRLDVWIARRSPGDAIRIPHVCGKLASVRRVAIQDSEPTARSDCHQGR